jgi:hypothetical protein
VSIARKPAVLRLRKTTAHGYRKIVSMSKRIKRRATM